MALVEDALKSIPEAQPTLADKQPGAVRHQARNLLPQAPKVQEPAKWWERLDVSRPAGAAQYDKLANLQPQQGPHSIPSPLSPPVPGPKWDNPIANIWDNVIQRGGEWADSWEAWRTENVSHRLTYTSENRDMLDQAHQAGILDNLRGTMQNLEQYADLAAQDGSISGSEITQGLKLSAKYAYDALNVPNQAVQKLWNLARNRSDVLGWGTRAAEIPAKGILDILDKPSQMAEHELGKRVVINSPTVDGVPVFTPQGVLGVAGAVGRAIPMLPETGLSGTMRGTYTVAPLTLGPSLAEQIDETYSDDPKVAAEVKQAAERYGARIAWSWPKLMREGKLIPLLKKLSTTYSAEERTALLRWSEDPIAEAISRTVVDPLNLVDVGLRAANMGIQTTREAHRFIAATESVAALADTAGDVEKVEDVSKLVEHVSAIDETLGEVVGHLSDVGQDVSEFADVRTRLTESAKAGDRETLLADIRNGQTRIEAGRDAALKKHGVVSPEAKYYNHAVAKLRDLENMVNVPAAEEVRQIVSRNAPQTWKQAAKQLTGRWRTSGARISRLGEMTNDAVQSAMHGIENPGELVDTLRRWDPNEIAHAETLPGRVVEGVLKDMGEADWAELRQSTIKAHEAGGSFLAKEHVAIEVQKRVTTKASELFHDWKLLRWSESSQQRVKRILSPVFLGANVTYPILNMADNIRMTVFAGYPVQAGRMAWDEMKALLRVGETYDEIHGTYITAAAQDVSKFLREDLGIHPAEAMRGFGGGLEIEQEAQLEAATQEALKTAQRELTATEKVKRQWDPRHPIPLPGQRSSEVEQVANSRLFQWMYQKAWGKLKRFGRGVRPLEEVRPHLAARLDEAGVLEEVRGIVENPRHYRLDQTVEALSKWEENLLSSAADGTGRVGDMNRYLTSTFDEDTLFHMQKDQGLMERINAIGSATDEGQVRKAHRELGNYIDKQRQEMTRLSDARNATDTGWGIYDVEQWRHQAAGPLNPFNDLPDVDRMLKGRQNSAADIIYRLSHRRGEDAARYMQPLSSREYQVIEGRGTVRQMEEALRTDIDEKFGAGTWDTWQNKAWAEYPQQVPIETLREQVRRIDPTADVESMDLEQVLQRLGRATDMEHAPPDELGQMVGEHLRQLDEWSGKPSASHDFWDLYQQLRPGATREAAQSASPAVQRALSVRNYSSERLWQDAMLELKSWVKTQAEAGQRVLLTADEQDQAQAVLAAQRKLFKYRQDPELIQTAIHAESRLPDAIRVPRPYPNNFDSYVQLTEHVKQGMAQVAEQAVGDVGRAPVALDRAALTELRDWTQKELKSDLRGTQFATLLESKARRSEAILNYADRTYVDSALGLVSPYSYWTTHNLYNWTMRIMDNPGRYAAIRRLMSGLQEMALNQDLPPHIREAYANMGLSDEDYRRKFPSRLDRYIPLNKFEVLLQGRANTPNVSFQPTMPLEALPVYGGQYLPGEWNDPEFTGKKYTWFKGAFGSNPMVDAGIVALNENILPALQDQNGPWANNALAQKFTGVLQKSLPPTQAVTGGSLVPMSRQIRAASLLMPSLIEHVTGGHVKVPPSGLNMEGIIADMGLGKYLGVERTSINEEYWALTELAYGVQIGQFTDAEAWKAAETRKGSAWDWAVRSSSQRSAVKTLGRIATGGAGRIQLLPQEEMVLRGQQVLYRKAKSKALSGDYDAIARFFADHPSYKMKQLSYDVWEQNLGKMTEAEVRDRATMRRKHEDYLKARRDVEASWKSVRDFATPGTPDYERLKSYHDAQSSALRDKYAENEDKFWAMVKDSADKRKAYGNRTKASSMRAWLEMFFSAKDQKERSAMLEALPTSMAYAQMVSQYHQRPQINFTSRDINQQLAKNLDPLDQTYAAAEGVYRTRVDEIYSPGNLFGVSYPHLAAKYKVYLAREWPASDEFLKANPDLAEALDAHRQKIEALWDQPVKFSQDTLDKILTYHPNWTEEERAQFRSLATTKWPQWTLREFSDRTKSDRELAIGQIWHFYNSLPAHSLDREQWLERVGPQFKSDFMSQHYENVSDAVLSLWMRSIPAAYSPGGQPGGMDIKKPITPPGEDPRPPEDMIQNIMSRLPASVLQDNTVARQVAEERARNMLKGPSPESRQDMVNQLRAREGEQPIQMAFQPGTSVDLSIDNTLKDFRTPQQAKLYDKRATALLHPDGPQMDEPWDTWTNIQKYDKGPSGAATWTIDQLREYGSLTKAIEKNPLGWERLVVGLQSMDKEQFLDMAVSYPDIAGVMEDIKDTQGPTYNMYYKLLGKQAPKSPFEGASAKELQDYQTAYGMYQRALNGEKDLYKDPLVMKYFPPNSPSARFWNTWYALPKSVRKELYSNDLVKTVMRKSARGYLDDQIYSVVLEKIRQKYSTELKGMLPKTTRETKATGTQGQTRYGYKSSHLGSRSTWEEIKSSAGPLLLGELGEVFRGSRMLTESARKALDEVRKQVAPGMSFEDFVQLIRGMYFRYGSFKPARDPNIRWLSASGSFTNRQRASTGGKFFVRR